MRAGIALFVGVLAVLGATAEAQAEVIFDNFGSGDTYQTNIGWTLHGGAGTPSDQDAAMSFVPTDTLHLDAISLAVTRSKGTNLMNVSLVADGGTGPGATALESWVFTDAMAANTQNGSPLTASSLARPLLEAGTTYWLVAWLAESSDTQASWKFNNIGSAGVPGSVALRGGSGAWSIQPAYVPPGAFRIEGTSPVPEPASIAFLGLGVVGLAAWRRRSRNT